MAIVRAEAVITGIGGGPGYSRMHYEVSDPSEGSTDMDFVRDSWQAFWSALDNGMYVGVTVTTGTELLIVNPASGQVTGAVATESDVIVGTDTANPLPWATQGLIRLRTGVYAGGREARGRIFIPGFTENTNDLGRVTSTGLDILNAGGTALFSEGAATPVVISKGAAYPVSSATAWNQWATLRGRRD